MLRFNAKFTGQESYNRKFASLFERIRCWELSLQNFVANYTVPWLRMVNPEPLEGSMKYLHGWSRRSEIEISSREFPNIYVSCRPAKPEGIGQLKIWGRNIFWPLTDSHVSFSPISSIETLQELGMLSMLNLWMSSTFNYVSDPALMIPCKTMQYHALQCNTMYYHAIPCNTI